MLLNRSSNNIQPHLFIKSSFGRICISSPYQKNTWSKFNAEFVVKCSNIRFRMNLPLMMLSNSNFLIVQPIY